MIDLGDGYVLRLAVSLRDAMGMRHVRNACSSMMTRDTSKIGRMRQLWWWYRRPDGLIPYVIEHEAGIVGYGIMLIEGRHGWLTKVFRDLKARALHRSLMPALEVMDFNKAAIAVYEKLGFRELHRNGPVITMELRS
jgi:hypothetical protein